jgi:hypothetical protein
VPVLEISSHVVALNKTLQSHSIFSAHEAHEVVTFENLPFRLRAHTNQFDKFKTIRGENKIIGKLR